MTVHRDDVHFIDRSVRATRVTLVGSLQTSEASGSDASVTQVPTSAVATTLLAANPSRILATLVNNANTALSIKYGVGASASDRTAVLAPGATWTVQRYTGIVTGVIVTGTGTASVTEVTP